MAQDTINIKDADGVNKKILAAMTPEGYSTITTGMELMMAVSMGLIEGYIPIDKFGAIEDIPTDSAADITSIGGDYTYDPRGSASITHISSADSADTNIPYAYSGLAIDGTRVSDTVTTDATDGQTAVALPTPLWRLFTVENDDVDDEAGGKDAVGNIYVGTESNPTDGVPAIANQRANVMPLAGRTLQAIYTVPLGYIGLLLRKRVTCMVGGGSSVYQDTRNIPDIIPALTDIKLRADNVTQTMGMFGTAIILLVPEAKIPPAYLTAIGQPSVMP